MKTKNETAKHTPGPWKIINPRPIPSFGESYKICGVSAPVIAEARSDYAAMDIGEGAANAALIAAAPEMLDELKKCRIAITFFREWMEDAIPGRKTKYPFGEDCEKSARAAIAKAEGRDA